MCWHKAGALWEVEIIRGVRAVLLQNQSGSAGEAAGFSVVFREWYWAMRLSEWFSFPSYFSRLFCFVQVHNCKKKYRSLSSSSETQHLGCYVQFWTAQCKRKASIHFGKFSGGPPRLSWGFLSSEERAKGRAECYCNCHLEWLWRGRSQALLRGVLGQYEGQ